MAHPLTIYRTRHNLSQAKLARLLNVSNATVCRWEAGNRKVDRDRLRDIAERTGIPVRDLRPDLAEIMDYTS